MKGLVTIHDGIADVRFTAYLDVSGDTSISAILPSLSNIVGFQSPLDSMGLAIDGRTVPPTITVSQAGLHELVDFAVEA